MKKFAQVFLLAVGLLLAMASMVGAAGSSLRVVLDGRELTLADQPVLMEGRAMVPLRGVFEAMGATVVWDEAAKTVRASREGVAVQLTMGRKTAQKNGQAVALDVPPAVLRGRVMVPLRFVSEALGAAVEWDGKSRTAYINSLPVVGSYENLRSLLQEAESRGGGGGMYRSMKAAQEAVPAAAPAAQAKNESASAADYSATNVQVQGVDEADIVKTDGKYIYQVNNRRVLIVQASPAEEMRVASVVNFQEEFQPQEIYVDAKRLVVIGSSSFQHRPVPLPAPEKDQAEKKIAPEIYPPVPARQMVKVLVYDISDPAQPRQLREAEIEGNYASSRKIGSALYLVANKYANIYYIMERGNNGVVGGENPTPLYRDTAGSGELTPVDYADIRYFPGHVEPNYLLVAGLDLDNSKLPLQVSTYLGSGQNVYASLENLYVAVTSYEQPEGKPMAPDTPVSSKPAFIAPPASNSTLVYKFALADGKAQYRGKGQVPGTLLNQFSMDEQGGYLRLATTSGEVWRGDEQTSKNNIYVLDENLQVTGRLEDLAPGERIYSARFMGDRVYLVTFRQVDPLFVIDLRDARAPRVLGKLKIPGYSDYLHPYDENHIIGFGKDTVELSAPGWGGDKSMAFYQGMKVAIFDVSDVEHPVEMHKLVIGDRGTDSELLHNHKALLFSREKNLLAFPVTLMEVRENNLPENGVPAYGQFAFQGAYVYRVDLQAGFTLRDRITHISAEDYQKAGQNWYDSRQNVERALYIGDTLYTLSQSMIKANDLADMAEKKSLLLPPQ